MHIFQFRALELLECFNGEPCYFKIKTLPDDSRGQSPETQLMHCVHLVWVSRFEDILSFMPDERDVLNKPH